MKGNIEHSMRLSENMPKNSSGSSLKNFALLAGAFSLLGLWPIPAAHAAYQPAFTLNNNTTVSVLDGPLALGYHFQTDIERPLLALGIYKTSPDFNQIGIWDFTDDPSNTNPGVAIFQVLHDKSQPCVDDGTYCWYAYPKLPLLEVSHDYVVAAAWGSEAVPGGLADTDLALIPDFGIGFNALSSTLPSLSVDFTDPQYAPTQLTEPQFRSAFYSVNLSFDTATTSAQTPGPLPLFGAAAAFGWSRKIRRRISTSS